jgi:hypothetical protein
MPTIEEVYRSPDFFIKKYEEAGVVDACPKIRHLIYQYIERKYVENAIAKSLNETNRAALRMTNLGKSKKAAGRKAHRQLIKRGRLAQSKKIAKLRVVRYRYQMILAKMPDLNEKLKRFPEITYTAGELTFDSSINLLGKHFRRQQRHRNHNNFWV